jgi:CRISPR-associated endonuclease/helicase Cas3
MAHAAVIGFADDASWKTIQPFTKADDDEPWLHPTLIAQTRLGERSLLVIPLFPSDKFDAASTPDMSGSKSWFLRALSLSRKSVVAKLGALGVPKGWEQSTLLRNCYPLTLDTNGRWLEDTEVRLDDELGLVYEQKEKR